MNYTSESRNRCIWHSADKEAHKTWNPCLVWHSCISSVDEDMKHLNLSKAERSADQTGLSTVTPSCFLFRTANLNSSDQPASILLLLSSSWKQHKKELAYILPSLQKSFKKSLNFFYGGVTTFETKPKNYGGGVQALCCWRFCYGWELHPSMLPEFFL